jgi:hypothetical protein
MDVNIKNMHAIEAIQSRIDARYCDETRPKRLPGQDESALKKMIGIAITPGRKYSLGQSEVSLTTMDGHILLLMKNKT